jgi:hypothetical protein
VPGPLHLLHRSIHTLHSTTQHNTTHRAPACLHTRQQHNTTTPQKNAPRHARGNRRAWLRPDWSPCAPLCWASGHVCGVVIVRTRVRVTGVESLWMEEKRHGSCCVAARAHTHTLGHGCVHVPVTRRPTWLPGSRVRVLCVGVCTWMGRSIDDVGDEGRRHDTQRTRLLHTHQAAAAPAPRPLTCVARAVVKENRRSDESSGQHACI